jgi:fatty acid/phospholipid biosynthesis enzyme
LRRSESGKYRGDDGGRIVYIRHALGCGAAGDRLLHSVMGSFYARYAIPSERPRVALLSNGTESSKGNDMTRLAAMILTDMEEVHFVGYVEGRDIPRNVADVVVCDGFVGNIVLKTIEGSVGLLVDSIKSYVEKSLRGKLGMWLANPVFHALFSEKLDPSAYGGAPLLGLNHIAIVCHGASKQRAIMNGIRVADKLYQEGLVGHMAQALSVLDGKRAEDYENGMWDRMESRFVKRRFKKNQDQAVRAPSALEDARNLDTEEG